MHLRYLTLFLTLFLFSNILHSASQEGSQLLKANKTASICCKLSRRPLLSKNEFLKTVLFIEEKLANFIEQKKYYLRQSETGLLCPIEYDPITRSIFIHLPIVVGQGADKKVTKSILYDARRPKIVARLVQKESEQTSLEVRTLKRLKGSRGVLQLVAQTKHSENGVAYVTFFTHYYSAGSLAAVINDCSYRFSLKEKMKIALDILKGLEMIEKRGIIHRDLKKENYLIEVVQDRKRKEGKTVKRRIQVVIADFGNALSVHSVQGQKPQLSSSYSAPEGIFFDKLRGSEYYKTDLFAAGCVLYRLFYERKPFWQLVGEKNKASGVARKKRVIELLEAESCKRRKALELKAAKNLKLTIKEQLELLILIMVHPEPALRSNAKSLRKKLVSILYQDSVKNRKFDKKS